MFCETEQWLSKFSFSDLIFLSLPLALISTDIKPENLLISSEDVLKLCDFGEFGSQKCAWRCSLVLISSVNDAGVEPQSDRELVYQGSLY